jgi:hypothetical protein
LRFGRVNTTLVLVCSERGPSDDDWSTWCRAYSEAAIEHRAILLFVVSRGGGPNARQRKEVIATLMEKAFDLGRDGFRTAVCGTSPVVRAITVAIGWLSGAPNMRNFGYEQREEALDYLRVPESDRPEVLQMARRLEQELREPR